MSTTVRPAWSGRQSRRQEPEPNGTLKLADWFNHRRLLESIGNVPPAESEETHYREESEPEYSAGLTEPSLR
jgi:hypothetical protein